MVAFCVPPASTIAITEPTSTVSPSAALSSVTTPASSEITSTFTLSVSSSTIFSPFSTLSPTCLNQVDIVPSVIDSANSGTLISANLISPLNV